MGIREHYHCIVQNAVIAHVLYRLFHIYADDSKLQCLYVAKVVPSAGNGHKFALNDERSRRDVMEMLKLVYFLLLVFDFLEMQSVNCDGRHVSRVICGDCSDPSVL